MKILSNFAFAVVILTTPVMASSVLDELRVIEGVSSSYELTMNRFHEIRAVTEEALKKHGVNPFEYQGASFTNAMPQKKLLKEEDKCFNKSLIDALSGYCYFRQLENFFIGAIEIIKKEKNAGISTHSFNSFCLGGSGEHQNFLETFEDITDSFDEIMGTEQEQPMLVHNCFILCQSDYMNNFVEGLWHLLTGKKGFLLKSVENHMIQNDAMIDKVRMKKIELSLSKGPQINFGARSSDSNILDTQIERLDRTIKSLDLTEDIIKLKTVMSHRIKLRESISKSFSEASRVSDSEQWI